MSHVFYRDMNVTYPKISHGKGIYLWSTDGKRYIDAASGALVANLGHGREDLARTLYEQAQRVTFAHTLRFTTAAQEEFATRVNDVLGAPGWYTYPVSGGSEATETAVKLARQIHLERGAPERYRVLSRRASYHGNTLGALAASGLAERQRPYSPLLSQAFVRVDPPQAACPGISERGTCACLTPFEQAIQQFGAETVAAIIVEPVGGASRSGFVPHTGYLPGLRRLCDQHGIILILDEVMTGFGRTGRMMGYEHDRVTPDLITAAKGLSGGYAPLGAVIASQRMYDIIRNGTGRFAHGLTYSGNPLSTAVGAKVLEILTQENVVANAATQGARLVAGLETLSTQYSWVRAIRGHGLMRGMLLEPRAGLAQQLVSRAWDAGIILYLGHGEAEGGDGEHFLIAPPLIIAPDEIDDLLARLHDIFAAVDRELL